MDLITDRTAADVTRLAQLNAISWDDMTPDERDEWMYGTAEPMLDPDGVQFVDVSGEALECLGGAQRGAYNATDLNRVSAAVSYVADRLEKAGYAAPVWPKTDWEMSNEPTRSQMAQYLADVRTLRDVLAILEATPHVPSDMEGLTWEEANDIERILLDVDHLITSMIAAYRHAGATVCGMGGLRR